MQRLVDENFTVQTESVSAFIADVNLKIYLSELNVTSFEASVTIIIIISMIILISAIILISMIIIVSVIIALRLTIITTIAMTIIIISVRRY